MATTDPFIIADSSGLVSLAAATDANHAPAVAAAKRLEAAHTPMIVPYEVFTETLNVLGRTAGHDTAIRTAHELASAPSFLVIDTDEQTRRAALRRFETQPQSVSYTDCVVMACAEAYHTTQIFGFDEAFKKNGFRRIQEEATAHAA